MHTCKIDRPTDTVAYATENVKGNTVWNKSKSLLVLLDNSLVFIPFSGTRSIPGTQEVQAKEWRVQSLSG